MRVVDAPSLLEFNDWANDSIMNAAAGVSANDLDAPASFTFRNLKDTLVHTLDVEWSWRILLQGINPQDWETSLSTADFPDLASIADRWLSERAERRSWLDTLTEVDMERIADIGGKDRFPLWYYLVHIVSHGEQQRRDAQLLLRSFGVEPPDLEFLYFADTLGRNAES